MQKAVFSKSAVATGALFILGDAVMYLPVKNSGQHTFWGFLTAIAVGFVLYFAVTPIYNFILNEEKTCKGLKKVIKTVILLVLAVAAAFAASGTFTVFTRFVSQVILMKTPMWIINIIFFGVTVFFATKRQEDSLKFALICFSFVIIMIILFFFGSISDYSLKNVNLSSLPNFAELIKETKTYIVNPVLPSLLLPFYYRLVFRKNRVSGHFGMFLGVLLLGVCILSAIMLFGTELACKLSNPYASAISTISVGRLYTRLDGFSYFIYFASAIIKINVCVFLAYSCLKKLYKAFG